MVAIKRQIVPKSIASRVTYGGKNQVKTVTIHQTGNTSKGADAQAHANIQSRGNSRSASWHYQVDDKEAIQSFDDTAQCWAAGDGRGPGNTQSVHIEICINSDGDYAKAVANGAELAKKVLDKHGLPTSALRQHYDWSRKNCPAQIRANKDGISWDDFKAMVDGKVKTEPAPEQQTKPATVSKPKVSAKKANLKVDGIWGSATTKALQVALGTPADGVISSQYRNNVTEAIVSGITFGNDGSLVVRTLQRKIGAKADGFLGPNTVRKLQAYLGTPQDGVISDPSMMVRELQRRLNAGTF